VAACVRLLVCVRMCVRARAWSHVVVCVCVCVYGCAFVHARVYVCTCTRVVSCMGLRGEKGLRGECVALHGEKGSVEG